MSRVGEDKFKEKLAAFIAKPEEDHNMKEDENCKTRYTREYLGLMMELGNQDKNSDGSLKEPNAPISPNQRRFQLDVAKFIATQFDRLCVVNNELLESAGSSLETTNETEPFSISSLAKLAHLLDITYWVNDMDKDLPINSRDENDNIITVIVENNPGILQNLLQVMYVLGLDCDINKTKKRIYDDVLDILDLLIQTKKGLKHLAMMIIEQKELNPMIYRMLLDGLGYIMSMISSEQSYLVQEISVEFACKIYAYFKRKVPEEGELIFKAIHSSLHEAFKIESGPSLIYQDAEARRKVLNQVNFDNPHLTSFKIKEASLVSSWIPIPLISSLHVVNYIDVGRLEMEMQTKVPQSDKLITLKMPYMDIIKSLIADQESQVTLVYPLYQLISNQDLSDIISKDVHIPTNAKTGQSFRVKIAFDSISDAEEFQALIKMRMSEASIETSVDSSDNISHKVFVATTLKKTPSQLQREAARRQKEEEAEVISEPTQTLYPNSGDTEEVDRAATSLPRRSKRISKEHPTVQRDDKSGLVKDRSTKSLREESSNRSTQAQSFPSKRERKSKRQRNDCYSDDDDFIDSKGSMSIAQRKKNKPTPKTLASSSKKKQPRVAKLSAARDPLTRPLKARASESPRYNEDEEEATYEPEIGNPSSECPSTLQSKELVDSYTTPTAARKRSYMTSELEGSHTDQKDIDEEDESEEERSEDQVESVSSDDIVSDSGVDALLLEIEKLKRKAHEKKILSSIKRDTKAAFLQAHDYLNNWLANACARCESIERQEETEKIMESIVALESDMKGAMTKYSASLESVHRKEETLIGDIDDARGLITALGDDFTRESVVFAKALEKLKVKCLRQVEENIKLTSTSTKKMNRKNIFS